MSLVKETTFVTDIKGLCPLYWIKMDCGVFNVDVFAFGSVRRDVLSYKLLWLSS